MERHWRVWSQRLKFLILRFSIPFLLLGVIGYYLLITPSVGMSPVAGSRSSFGGDTKDDDLKPTVSVDETHIIDQQTQTEKCDIFTGDWIPNPSGPAYTNETCPFIESRRNCMKNGRPDAGYLYWRWNPRNCKLPQFNPRVFLNLMKNKSWALVGDSISRNHALSLLCLLSQVEQATEISHDDGDEEYRSRTWVFPSYNFTVSAIWSPFLVQAVTNVDSNGVALSTIELHLDKLDKTWTDRYQSFDYMVFSSGEWFIRAAIYFVNDTVVGCHYCPGKNLTEVGYEFAYRNSLTRVLNFIVTTNRRGSIFFRTSAPDHFEHGEWDSGGVCHRTEPAKEGELEFKQFNAMLRKAELEKFNNVMSIASENGVDLRLLDVAPLSLLRPDGHPGPYMHFHPYAADKNAKVQKDCLHWCLPGPIDYWNDMLMEMVVKG